MTEPIKNRKFSFWDIESVANIFMFAFYYPRSSDGQKNKLLYFYLYDDKEITADAQAKMKEVIFELNPEITPDDTDIAFFNLTDKNTNISLLNLFCVNNKGVFDSPEKNDFRKINPVLNSDLVSPANTPYLCGYNIAQYDITMMAEYFTDVWGFDPFTKKESFLATTAENMHKFNNKLFQGFKENMPSALVDDASNIYDNMIKSGLFLDVAKINDKIMHLPLKRIMGMKGMDIFEDDLVKDPEKKIETFEELCHLFAYNASDVIKLHILFQDKAFQASYVSKQGLLDTYRDLIYDKDGNVRIGRLKIDDSSAKFAARVLCPDGFLPDIKAVSFEYPKNSGRNILKETREWAESKLTPEAYAQVKPIFDYYGSIEGKNFDDSDHYIKTYPMDGLPVSEIRKIPHPCTCVPYFNKDGSPSSTYVNFSIGGIHGAEYNQALYEADLAEYKIKYKEIDDFVSQYTDAELAAMKSTIVVNGVSEKLSKYVTKRKDGTIVRKYPKPVELFKMDKKSGNWSLNKKYVYCSDDEVDHDDFTSYYPCLLMNMQAYKNDALGEDRYVQQFNNKGLYGKYMKDENRTKEERAYYKILRECTKLILNSASGASDTNYDTNIRMNNVIISMRLIGQMFTWRIGQAQTLEGFKVTSTNTDGLYVKCDSTNRELCRKILEKEANDINVGIEPEEMRLVSKDANNRIELSLDNKLLTASGGDVSCYDGPIITKAVSHPAIIDAMLVKYLTKYGVNKPFNIDNAIEVLKEIKAEKSSFELLMLYQQIVNSAESSCRYIFATKPNGTTTTLQHNNRIFAIKSEAARLYIANATDTVSVGHNELADEVLRKYGVNPSKYKSSRIIKINGIEPTQNIFIYNKALDALPEQTMIGLINNLDDGYYVERFAKTYGNWCNVSEHSEEEE